MKRQTRKLARNQADPVLLFSPGLEELDELVTNLNAESICVDSPVAGGWKRTWTDNRQVRRELRRLVKAWVDSGPNVHKLINAEHALARAARRFRAHLVPTQTGYARLAYYPIPENFPVGSPLAAALGLFMRFLLNPYNESLGGPCSHCDNYYVKKDPRQTVYCSQRCGLRHTSLTTNQKRRKKEHDKQLRDAKRAASNWATARTKLDWKEWVFRRTRISKSWLTRAVRNKELSEPLRQRMERRL